LHYRSLHNVIVPRCIFCYYSEIAEMQYALCKYAKLKSIAAVKLDFGMCIPRISVLPKSSSMLPMRLNTRERRV
jgi:hypothetical protein